MNRPKYHDQLPGYLKLLADEYENLAYTRRSDDLEVSRLGGKAQALRLAADIASTLVMRPTKEGEGNK